MDSTFLSLTLVMIMEFSGSQLHIPCDFDNRCHCLNNLQLLQVNCSRSNITSIPHFPSNVSVLDLQHNFIDMISNGKFENLSKLTELDLSWNHLKYLESGSFIGLYNLKRLILKRNKLEYSVNTFPKGVFKPLISLIHLDIKFNTNSSVYDNFPDEVIADLTELRNLEIDAYVSSIYPSPFGKGFATLNNLRKLKTGWCFMYYLDNKTFANLQLLEVIDLSMCWLHSYEKCSFCRRKILKYLDLSGNSFHIQSINNLVVDLQSTSIEVLGLSSMIGAPAIPLLLSTVFSSLYNTGIRDLYFGGNWIAEVSDCCPSSFLIPPKLQTLDFSFNELTKFYLSMPYLINLNLQSNLLGKYLAFHPYLRSNETRLRSDDLSWNSIHKLTFSIFHGHSSLEIINLSHNNLQDLTFDLSQLTNLRVLDLSSNNIETFNQSTRKSISNILKQTNLKMDLTNNTLQCTCTNILFLRWIKDNLSHFLRSHTYKCKFDNHDNSSVVILNRFGETILQLEKECSSYILLIICISIGIVAACIVVISGLVYRYRWKLRYMYYMTKSKYYRYKPMETDEVYTYNAFIAYSNADRDFIVKECIPNLEENGNIKLCIHQRDFLAGEDITVNITNAIHDSKKTICVISRSFLDSYYCMFEFNMARMESIYSRNGRNILFLVFYEQILHRDLPLVMLELVQQQSYIEFPRDEQDRPSF